MPENRVQTLDRSLDILEELSRNNKALGVTEIGKKLGLGKSTVHRTLQTLCWRGYLTRENGNYRLGLKIIELASVMLGDLDIRKLAEPILQNVATILDETAHLVLLDEGQVIYIDTKGSSQKIINMYSKVGRRAPVHATAVGKAMLAFLPENEAKAILINKGIPKLTETTITNLDELMGQLKEIHQVKIAHDVEENEFGIYCIGTPIFDYSGNVAGGVSVSGPTSRMKEKGLDYLATIVKKAGEELSTEMGFVKSRQL